MEKIIMRLVYNKKSNKAPTFLRKSMPVIKDG